MRIHTTFYLEALKGRDHLGDLNVDEKMILKLILKKYGCEGMDSIQVVLDKIQKWALVNTVMNLQAP
jgi:hypothetical protein